MKRLFAYFAHIAIAASCFAQSNPLATRAYCDHNVDVAASQAQALFQTNIPHIVDQVTDQIVDDLAPTITNVVTDIVGDLTITNVYEGYAEFAYIALTNSFLQGSFDNADVMSFGQPSIAFGIDCKPYFNISFAAGTNSYSTGEIAFAFGENCIAGNRSFAFGNATHAENIGFAIGDGTSATGATSAATGMFASGYRTIASGKGAHAEGEQTIALGNYSHSEGANTIAYASGAHAEGYGTSAYGQRSHAEGQYTVTSNYFAHAEGNWCYALGHSSHAEGRASIAEAGYSHADGVNARTQHTYSYAWSGVYTAGQVTNSAVSFYNSHGNGTYNINPIGGISGFYIGEQNLGTIISNIVLSIIASQQ